MSFVPGASKPPAAAAGPAADEKKEEIVFDVKVKYLLTELRRIRREKPKSKVQQRSIVMGD